MKRSSRLQSTIKNEHGQLVAKFCPCFKSLLFLFCFIDLFIVLHFGTKLATLLVKILCRCFKKSMVLAIPNIDMCNYI